MYHVGRASNMLISSTPHEMATGGWNRWHAYFDQVHGFFLLILPYYSIPH